MRGLLYGVINQWVRRTVVETISKRLLRPYLSDRFVATKRLLCCISMGTLVGC